MLGVLPYLWRLVPANPILLRVVDIGSKRKRDLVIRWGYLGLLILLVVLSLLSGGGTLASAGLSELAQISGRIFQRMSYLQLALVALLAPIFTAGAITQEKDSQTYDILLSTPLTNGQIVLGSLLSRLFFVVALLLSGIPIFAITQIFGGVALSDIAASFAIAAATAFITGALAMAIATFGVGTRRTIFSFYLFIVAYLAGLYLLDGLPIFHPAAADGTALRTSWLTGLNPFLALQTYFGREYLPPTLGELPPSLRGWPMRWYWTHPASFYIVFMFLLSAVMVIPSIVLLRRIAQSTVSLRTALAQKLHLVHPDRTRAPRPVWSNPIAWREARTKSSAARSFLLRYGFMAAGLGAALILVWLYAAPVPGGRYLAPSSYNAATGELTVYSDDAAATTYRLARNVEVKVDGQKTDVAALGREYAVRGEMSIWQSPDGPVVTGIALGEPARRLPAQLARQFLLGLITLEFAAILLIVTNAAASTVTREREDGTLDLLLSTPITSRYYVWGKLRGLVSYILPLVAIPALSAGFFVAADFFAWIGSANPSVTWLVFPEAVLLLPGVLVIVAALAGMVGMQMSLRCRTTVTAVMGSVGILLGFCAVLGWCGFQTLTTRMAEGPVPLVIGSLSPFTVLSLMIDPIQFGGRYFLNPTDAGHWRIILFIFTWIALALYALVVWSMYKSMVKNFDMTMRRS
jgi:ABC-type transport system involved in multi-copper enzyme maturation permease subunit